ncbi:MAG: potassium channel family protein [Fluviibacter sp.]
MNNSVLFLVLRRMRAPLIAIILIYAVSILGLVLIPGIDADGRPTSPISFFDAFYFISYTATTIGFGEIPGVFSYGQRFWVTVCIYLTVIGWSYAILSILNLLKDEGLQRTLATNRFARKVRNLSEPFCIICGAGDTGTLICRTLDQVQMRFVALDVRPEPLQELELGDYSADVPALHADSQQPETLLLAGLRHPNCKAVIAVTNNDEANLAIAMNVRLLNPGIPIIARAEHAATAANLQSFGTNFIVDPYALYARRLALAMKSPPSYQLVEWLTRVPGTPLPALQKPPTGKWIICGYGHFGRAIVKHLDELGLRDEIRIIDPRPTSPDDHLSIVSSGTEASPLIDAGIADAVGLVAASDNDINNLSIAITARELNPSMFIVMRQSSSTNSLLFDAFDADLTMITTHTIAHACLSYLTTPMLSRFIREVELQTPAWSQSIIDRLKPICEDVIPFVWSSRINRIKTPALFEALQHHDAEIPLATLMRSNRDRSKNLKLLPLMLERAGQTTLLPDAKMPLHTGDKIIWAGLKTAWDEQKITARYPSAFNYVAHGRTTSGTWLGNYLDKIKRPLTENTFPNP